MCMGFEDEFYSMGEVAKTLKLSRATVLRRVRDGVLPPLVDGLRRFRGEDLRATVGCRRTWLSVLAERLPRQS